MAKFTNTQRVDTINTIVDDSKRRIDSPYNIQLNLKPYVVKYWNQDIENTTMDEGSKQIYSHTGNDSPIAFNSINNAIMYGLPQFQIDLELGDFGLESGSFSGESTILPNTWIPYSGDYFAILHSGSYRCFSVNSVTPDTLPNGANFYKIEFSYASKTPEALDALTTESFEFIYDNVGSNFSSVIRSSTYNLIENIEAKTSTLKVYYKELFYRNDIQTFVYDHDNYIFYDPYMIEFLSRNLIMNDDHNFAYIGHALPISKTFSIEYDKTFLHTVEEKDKERNCFLTAIANEITNKLSLFYYRSDTFYQIHFGDIKYASDVPIVEMNLYYRIKNNDLYMSDDIESYKNIIIKYFNNSSPTNEEINNLLNIPFENNIQLFYNIPIIIYILERYTRELIAKRPKQDISTAVTYK